jgi:tetratricopeptide (TPR) repeat protein
MSTKVVHENAAEKVTLSQRLNDFLAKNRAILISVLAIALCVFIALVIVTVVSEKKSEKAFVTVESVLSDWEKARSAEDKTGLPAKEDELIGTLKKTANSNKNTFAGARALNTVAEIYYSRKDWKNAEENYLAAAAAAPRAYSNGINYFNAAVCADEQGNQDKALEYYTKALDADNFALKPRALFNIGRIQEQQSHKDEAIATYAKLSEQFPNDEWTSLAKSRTIALQILK